MTRKDFFKTAKDSVVRGFFWAIGVSMGLSVVTTLLAFVFTRAETLPLVGGIIASIVQATLESLGTAAPGV